MVSTDSLNALREILGCIQTDGAQHSHALLEEGDEHPEAKLKKLTISELGPGMLVLATDKGRKRDCAPACMSPLFASDGRHDQNRACDAVLLRKAADGSYEVYYIELKSDSPSGYAGQFKSTQCFINYLFLLSKSLCGCSIDVKKERFVIFHTDSKNGIQRGLKIKTRFKPKSKNTPDSPDLRCVNNGDTVRCTEFF